MKALTWAPSHLGWLKLITTGSSFYNKLLSGAPNPAPSGPDPYWSDVVSLMHFDGANGSAVLVDETGLVWPNLSGGNIITTTRARFGSSLLLNSYIQPSTYPTAVVGTQDFTYEVFVYREGSTEFQLYNPSGPANNIYVNPNDNTLRFSDAYNWFITTSTVPIGSFVHLAICRAAGMLYLFINGVLGLKATNTTALPAAPFKLWNTTGGANTWVDEFRSTVGVGRYTSNFIPPTTPFANYS